MYGDKDTKVAEWSRKEDEKYLVVLHVTSCDALDRIEPLEEVVAAVRLAVPAMPGCIPAGVPSGIGDRTERLARRRTS